MRTQAPFTSLIAAVAVLLLSAALAFGARSSVDPAAISRELKEIRKNTDWSDPVAAKRANERTQQLMKKLNQLQAERKGPSSPPSSQSRQDAEEIERSAADNREKMWDKVQQAGTEGPGALADLAEPVRQKVVEEYQEDRDPAIRNPAYYQELTVLVIDLSTKEAPALIQTMDKFTSIKTLVLTGGKNGAPVDLPYILNKAKNMPLTGLYIVDFRGFVTAIPESISQFPNLTKLSLFDNSIRKLPAGVAKMKNLKVLHVDINPITTLLPTIKGLAALEELGVGKTKISAVEQGQLSRLLPNCRIVTK